MKSSLLRSQGAVDDLSLSPTVAHCLPHIEAPGTIHSAVEQASEPVFGPRYLN